MQVQIAGGAAIGARTAFAAQAQPLSIGRAARNARRKAAPVELHRPLGTAIRLLERQPVALAFAVGDVGVRASGDHVRDLRVPLHDRRQRLDHSLEPFPLGDQAEGGEEEPLAVRPGRALRGPVREHGRGAVRHDADLLGGARAALDEQPPSGVRHHDHALGLAAEGAEHLGLVPRRLRQHRVQRHDERLRQLLRQRDDVLAVGAAEDAVLVLEQDDVDMRPRQDPRCADVVAADRLGDRRDDTRLLWAGGLVDDHDLVHAVDAVHAEERGAHVGREGADAAGARWVGGDDRGAHGPSASLQSRFPAGRRGVGAAGARPP